MSRPATAKKIADEYLLRLANLPQEPVGVSELARRAGVSYVTMWKAVKHLKLQIS